jgi:hypothetical protein
VYVNYGEGNWSEGLTAYLADHLMQEQKGTGAEYRRSMLQKYSDFVSAGRDFPLTQFTSRNSASSEAVGYGKSMMMFHMLRRQLEDDRFTLALQNFYKVYKFKSASYAEMEPFFSQAGGLDLKPFFKQWTQQLGAPKLRLVSVSAENDRENYQLTVSVEQTQSGAAYALDVPIVVTLAGDKDVYSTVLKMTDKQAEMHLSLTEKPLRVDIDPEFDLFRYLDRAEMPAAFSQVFGAQKLLVILPRKAAENIREEYSNIAQSWQQQPARNLEIKWDDEIETLPQEGAVWLFGWENKFRNRFQQTLDPSVAKLDDLVAVIGGKEFLRSKDVIAMTSFMDKTPVAWLATPTARQLSALARKLPHYAKYSYAIFNDDAIASNGESTPKQQKQSWLGFPGLRESNPVNEKSGGELINIAKGSWPLPKSPLTMLVQQVENGPKDVKRGVLAKRSALAH